MPTAPTPPVRWWGGLPVPSAGLPHSWRHRASTGAEAQELFTYPFGFHSAAADSGWLAPVLSQARAVMVTGPGGTSTVSDHSCHAHGLSPCPRLAFLLRRPP